MVVKNTGPSTVVSVRLKSSGVAALDKWRKGRSRADYIRALLKAEAEAQRNGRTLVQS